MTPAEIPAFNAGVSAVLTIAAKKAEAINRTSKSRVHEDFAVAALDALAEAGRALLTHVGTRGTTVSEQDPTRKPI